MLVFSAMTGTVAALLWGVGDLLAKVYIPRWGGGIRWVLWGQLVGAIGFALFFWISGYQLPPLAPMTLALLLVFGLVGLGGYLFFFTAVEYGHLSIVSPISASWAGIAFILSAVFLPEAISPSTWAMLLAILIGVILTSIPNERKRTMEEGGKRRLAGLPVAIAAAIGSSVCWGAFNFFVKFLAERSDPWLPIFAIKLWGALVCLALVAKGRYRLPDRPGKRAIVALPFAAGIDSVAYYAYTRGAQGGSVPITAAFASLFSLFAVLFGVVILKEKLSRVQVAGIALIIIASFGLFYFV